MALTQISTAGVKDDAVTSGKIPANAVGSSELADNAVDTAAIANDAVTADKLADNTVGTSNIVDQTVTLAKLPHGDGSSDGKFLRANNGADPTFETITGTTINNNADNRVITGSGTANTLNGEANLSFDGVSLHLNSGSNGLPKLRLQHSGSGNDVFEITSGLTGVSNGGFGIYDVDASAYRFAIDSSGKVGIGTTSPTRPLHITSDEDLTSFTGTTKGAFCISNNDYASGEYSAIDFTYTGSDNPLARIAAKITGGGTLLSFGTSGNYSNGITNEALTINTNGNVGIGTTSPVEILHIKEGTNKNVHFTGGIGQIGNVTGLFAVNDANNAIVDIGICGSTVRVGTTAGERARFTGDGLCFNGDTAAANALDDYEEGTFTITAGGGSNAVFHAGANSGSYTKIGRQVTIAGQLLVTSGNNALRIDLPFNSAANTADDNMTFAASVIGYGYNAVNSSDCDGLFIMIDANATYARFMEHKDNNPWVDLICDPNGYLRFTITYFTS